MTDPLGQSQVLPYLTGLSAKGWNITLISAEKEERSAVVDTIQEICDGSSIDWRPINYTKKPPVFSTFRDVRTITQLAYQLHKTKMFSIIHCRSYISALVGLKMKKKFGVKFLFDMRGFWADERIEGDIWNPSNPLFKGIYNYFKKKERQFFAKADYTISLTEKAKLIIHKEITKSEIPIEVIPCCADTEHFSEDNTNDQIIEKLKYDLGLNSSDKVMAYIGSLGTWYMLDEMLFFYKFLIKKYPKFKFLFLTLDDPKMITQKCEDLSIPIYKIIVTSSSRAQLPNYMRLIDCSIFFIRPSFSKQASSPTKMGELMSMGIPVIANDGVGDSTELIQKYKAGVLVDLEEENSFENAVNNFDNLLNLSKSEIRKGALDFFSLEGGVEKYHNIYKILAS